MSLSYQLQRVPDMIGKSLTFFFGSRNERIIKSLQVIVDTINGMEDEIKALSDEELGAKTPAFRDRLAKGESLDDILPEAFAVVREAAVRTLGQRHYDVQLMGGILLHRGIVVEMMTGEGKTLVATLPAYLNALTGKGVHVVTVNDFLASRDAEWMGQVYRFLGLTVGCIVSTQEDPAEKRDNYNCDITYGTNNEFGFDYLRDNMKVSKDELVQRELHYAIVDEADSVFIDEARTPLIISGPAEMSDEKYIMCDKAVRQLKKGRKIEKKREGERDIFEGDFYLDEKETNVTLTEEGVEKCEKLLGINHLYSGENMSLPHFLNNALRAHNLFKRDKDYVVQNGEVIIVDEHTGRMMPGRRWSDGLHQAVEVKEGLPLKRESQTLASITFQNLFRLYDKLAGMTGTAITEASEFMKIYKLDVMVLPTNRPCIRKDYSDIVYGTPEEKFQAVIKEIRFRHAHQQPILVGTASIEVSELMSAMLTKAGIAHKVLNAKQHEKESHVIMNAGALGAVTVATNMAGRGTDILLGGNPEELAREESKGDPKAFENLLQRKKAECAEAKIKILHMELNEKLYEGLDELTKNVVDPRGTKDAAAMGLRGLFVLGSERHESRRIDNQLRGRCGRQGDPGASRFYLSLNDDLMRRFSPPWARRMMQKSGLKEGESIEHAWITKAISNAQKKVEEFNFEVRKNLLEYDEVMNAQRKVIYSLRNKVLNEDELKELLYEWVEDAIYDRVNAFRADASVAPDQTSELEDSFKTWVKECFLEELPADERSLLDREANELEESVFEIFKTVYEKKEKALGPDICRYIEKYLLLGSIDRSWKEHLHALDNVRDTIGWRGYAQVDPKIEYKKEAFALFKDMLASIKMEAAGTAVRLTIANPEDIEMKSVFQEGEAKHAEATQAVGSGGEADEESQRQKTPEVTKPIVNKGTSVGRNDLCPCGSGKKYKNCHGKA